MSAFPVTSVTLIAKIRNLGPENDSAEWVRFWDSYSLAIRNFAAIKRLARETRVVELATDPVFVSEYMERMMF